MNKTLTELRKCKKIIEVTVLSVQDIAFDNSIKRNVPKDVDLFKIKYKVGKFGVTGYVAAPQAATEVPCLIHLRGGGGDFSMLKPKSLIAHLVRFAHQGYVVIATQYPGVDGGDGVDEYGGVDDLKSIKVLREILKDISAADHSCIGLKGHSRGGLMAYMLLREVKWIKAIVIGGAPTDQIRQAKERPDWRQHQIKLWGKSHAETLKRSPLRWVQEFPKKTPILLMHGSSDWRVNPLDSIEMSQQLCRNRVPHRFILFEGADHVISEHRDEYVQQTANWFERFLKNNEPLPEMKEHGD